MEYLLSAVTDVGIKKEINQDAILLKSGVFGKDKLVLAVICDGMGGLQKGEAASASVVRAFGRWFDRTLPAILTYNSLENPLFRSWNELIKNMNRKIDSYGTARNLRIGTTLTAILFYKKYYYYVHVGDCRIYEIGKTIRQLSKDQTLVQREVEMGLLTPEEAKTDPRRHVLLQCIGASETVSPIYKKGKTLGETMYLLCSDGFRHVVSKEELHRHFYWEPARNEKNLQKKLYQMVRLIKERGETDNISAIAIQIK
jgi:serine/threonine protein phosphatase PrpC